MNYLYNICIARFVDIGGIVPHLIKFNET